MSVLRWNVVESKSTELESANKVVHICTIDTSTFYPELFQCSACLSLKRTVITVMKPCPDLILMYQMNQNTTYNNSRKYRACEWAWRPKHLNWRTQTRYAAAACGVCVYSMRGWVGIDKYWGWWCRWISETTGVAGRTLPALTWKKEIVVRLNLNGGFGFGAFHIHAASFVVWMNIDTSHVFMWRAGGSIPA